VNTIDLNGSWTLSSSNEKHPNPIEARVPGCVHTALLAAGTIEDPYYRDNEQRLQWIGESDWTFSHAFQIDPGTLAHAHVILRAEGLDTLSEVTLNGRKVGNTDNMFRTWEWDVRAVLQPGTNTLSILFRSPLPYAREKQKSHHLAHVGVGDFRIEGGGWVRKEACNYGWDWGPMLLTHGIWRPISIVAWNEGRILDCFSHAEPQENNAGSLHVRLSVQPSKHALEANIRLSREGSIIENAQVSLTREGTLSTTLEIDAVELWWPAGLGAQPLYDLEVFIVDPESKEVLDRKVQKIGFRKLELITEFDPWGQSFKFRANGRDFFAKGANWIPADTFDDRVSESDLRDLLQSAKDAHMNCLRVWGGGIYEQDAFYELCDELGICVWQDFMFACTAYPVHEPEFIANVLVEAETQVKRLRHHASVFLWCGNNELEHMFQYIGDFPGAMRWDHYSNLFDQKLASVVEKHHPHARYWPASDHSPVGDRVPGNNSGDPRWGDAHLWKVWHGREPFEWYRGSLHRFCSEFGFQSFPEPATVATYTTPTDRSVTSRIMELHQRSPNGNQLILAYMLDWFRLPSGFDHTLWLSQILQSLGIKYAVEHWRRNMPRCMGATYWQLNDCWPVASWSSIDSLHRWKALHYEAKRFFAPDLVSVIEDAKRGTLAVFLTSDRLESISGTVTITAWHTASGKCLDHQEVATVSPVNGSACVGVITPVIAPEKAAPQDVVFSICWMNEGNELASNMITWVRPKHLNLEDPEITWEPSTEPAGDQWITLSCQKPALWVWLSIPTKPDHRWSDQFFHLYPGQKKKIRLASGPSITPEDWASLRVRSLRDTYWETGMEQTESKP
jgi:beta-mannosidase